MITITFERNGETNSRKVHSFALDNTLASYRAAGYTIISDGSTPVPAKVEAPATGTTGRVGNGLTVHKLVEGGGTECGTGYRRGKNLEFKVTGETVNCARCAKY